MIISDDMEIICECGKPFALNTGVNFNNKGVYCKPCGQAKLGKEYLEFRLKRAKDEFVKQCDIIKEATNKRYTAAIEVQNFLKQLGIDEETW